MAFAAASSTRVGWWPARNGRLVAELCLAAAGQNPRAAG
jgi:hypothetical protein